MYTRNATIVTRNCACIRTQTYVRTHNTHIASAHTLQVHVGADGGRAVLRCDQWTYDATAVGFNGHTHTAQPHSRTTVQSRMMRGRARNAPVTVSTWQRTYKV